METLQSFTPTIAELIAVEFSDGFTHHKFWKLFRKPIDKNEDHEVHFNTIVIDFKADDKTFIVHDLFCNFPSIKLSMNDFRDEMKKYLRGSSE